MKAPGPCLPPENKNLPSALGREGVPAVPPKLIALSEVEGLIHFAPTIIGLPCNAGTAVQTTAISPERLGRELRSVSVERGFQRFLRLSGGICRRTFLCLGLYRLAC